MKKVDPDFEYIKTRKNLINEDGSVTYGSFNEPLNLNFQDFKLKTFFGKNASKRKAKNTLKKFNYYSIATEKFILAVGFVKIKMFYNCFIYIYKRDKGIIYNKSIDILGPKKAIYFGDNYDFTIDYHSLKRKNVFKVNKSSDGFIKFEFKFDNKVKGHVVAKIPKDYERLIVCNPASLTNFTFTEKMYAIPAEEADISINDHKIITTDDHPLISSDWSAGYFKKQTTWIWWAGQGKVGNHFIGFNFATFINDAMYPERAVWVDNKKYEFSNILFEVNVNEPFKGARLFTKDDSINLKFTPVDVKTDIKNRIIILTNFKQFVGHYDGYIKIKNVKYTIKNMNGFFELHDSKW